MDSETKAAVMKMSVAGAGASLYGLTLNEWMALVTIFYVVMQIGLLIPKYWELIFKRGKK
ncbi:hypothetical protein [Pelistega sp. MC2]|uniref:hypothetical protein n=1 Tax=Pelistega sp. MC2 TaxID=1720297 RepID=UPI0008D99F04|nr:hypothetical protein [Pelistega sp. MC2]